MPANLTPQYLAAEKRFREARSLEERILALEEMLATLPKHKGTDKLKAMLRRRMASLLEESRSHGGRKGHDPYLIRREGAGQVALYGLPNSGKSSLLGALTKASSPVADYPFTTRSPVPGMMAFENIQIQLVDLPPLMDEAAAAWLPRVLGRADALAFILDSGEDPGAQMEVLAEGLREMGLPCPPGPGSPEGEAPTAGGFICLAKADLARGGAWPADALSGWRLPRVSASVLSGAGLGDFRRAAFEALGIIRVYTKAPREKAALHDPIVLPAGSTLETAAESLHKDFALGLKYARVWGKGFYDGQMVGRDHVLHDGDVVEFHL